MSGLYEQRCDMLQEQNEHVLDLSGQSMQGRLSGKGIRPHLSNMEMDESGGKEYGEEH